MLEKNCSCCEKNKVFVSKFLKTKAVLCDECKFVTTFCQMCESKTYTPRHLKPKSFCSREC